jgi:antitoxin CcdA
MGHDRNAPKRPINVSLNEDLVRRARGYTRNLSGTIEGLLQNFVAAEDARRLNEDQSMARVIDQFGAFHAQFGLLSDEFSGL